MSRHLRADRHHVASRRAAVSRGTAAVAILGLLATLGGGLQAASGAASGPVGAVIARGLDNPRGLDFRGNVLYIAEAGHGGPWCAGKGEMGPECYGLTGRLSRLSGGRLERVATHLTSIASPNGGFALGMVAVSSRAGKVYGLFSESTAGIPAKGLPLSVRNAARAQLGQVARPAGHRLAPFAGVGDFDYSWSKSHKNLVPGQFPDANPNGIWAAGTGAYVADAATNTLNWVGDRGDIHILAFLDVPAGSPTDSVPTCVAKGPDRAVYVGELLGGSFAPGRARVWRYAGGKARVWKTGFTTIQGCGFDSRGNFYATEFATGGLAGTSRVGAVVQIARDGKRTVFGTGQLRFPSGFASRGNQIYVSNWSVMPAVNKGGPTGQVVRFTVP